MKQLFIILLSFLIFQIAGKSQNVFPATGNVGIGKATPLSLLDIGSATRSGSFAGGSTVFGPFQMTINSTSSSNSSIAAYIYNHQTVANSSSVIGIRGWVNTTNLTGTTTNSGNAISAVTEHSGTGTLTWGRAFTASGFLSSTGIITNWAAFYSAGMTATGGSVTNGYGLYLAAFPGGVTNKYGIYAVDANAMNYFAGNVGIGTTSPGTNKLAVEGTIGARKVIVTLQNPWPDYVFHKKYKLIPLIDLEKYIKANNHLPNMPNENEIKKDGIDLAQMNAKLLEKVEELTLYMIDLKKENEKIKKEIIKLKKHYQK